MDEVKPKEDLLMSDICPHNRRSDICPACKPDHAGIKPVYGRMLAVYELLRRAGFTPDDIAVTWRDNAPATALQQPQGVFFINYPKDVALPRTSEQFEREWIAAGNYWNDTSNAERERLFVTHRPPIELTAKMMMAIKKVGIKAPFFDASWEQPCPNHPLQMLAPFEGCAICANST
ncbi:MAG: hypothetical protein EPN91_01310 [Salinibacterium sp.]|nr:MAG: hypothetical protein EPN91_01310 [Salinibacterium sp.]